MSDLEPITRNEKLWSGEDLTPVTRKEMYIKHLYDETQVIPEYPVTREEMFILKAGEELHDVTIEQLTATENRTYSEEGVAYSPVIVNVPLPENAYLLKEIEDVEIATFTDGSNLPMPKLEVAIEPVQDLHGYDYPWVGGSGKNKLQNVRSTTTVNGITFTVNSDGSVFIAGGQTASEFTVFNLIANNLNYYNLTDFGLSYNTDYILNGCPSGGSATTYRLVFRSGGAAGNKVDAGTGVSFNIASDGDTLKWMPCIMIDNGYTIPSGGLLFKPMIRLATVSDATFAPYSNICPIIGHTEVDVTRTGKNLWGYGNISGTKMVDIDVNIPIGSWTFSCEITSTDVDGTTSLIIFYYDDDTTFLTRLNRNTRVSYTFTATKHIKKISFYAGYNSSQSAGDTFTFANIQLEIGSTPTAYEPYNGHTYTIDLDGTRYGGKVDLVSGVMVLTDGYIASYNGETLPSTWISDRDVYSEGTAPTTGAEVVYKLATPLTIQLTPTVVKSLRGMNNVFADTGDILDLSYLAKEE